MPSTLVLDTHSGNYLKLNDGKIFPIDLPIGYVSPVEAEIIEAQLAA